APAAAPVPEHTVVAVLRDYMPSSNITIKQGESIRFVDADPTAGPGHSFTENVPEGVAPKFDSDIVPPGTFKDVPNISSLPPGKYTFHCKIHEVLKGALTVG
ncbi:MAG TPA: cupredoxin domain-containing protein, partial [Acidimicrobiia bacterium]|nr:cupredoxin domain-containing protein [Acidimicrobiia bacterium]